MKKLVCLVLVAVMAFGFSTIALATGLSYSHTTNSYFTTSKTAGHANIYLYFDNLLDTCDTLQYNSGSKTYRYSRAYKVNSDGTYSNIGPYCPVMASGSPTTVTITYTNTLDLVKMRVFNGYYHDNGTTTISMTTSGSFIATTHGDLN